MRRVLYFVCWAGLQAQPASIAGTAVNSITHEPLSDVHIRLVAVGFNGFTGAYGAMSDSAGHFSIAVIRPGAYLPEPERSGFIYVRPGPPESMLAPITIRAGEHRTNWLVEMVPRAILSGRVLDENGDPVQGISVRTVDAGAGNLSLGLGSFSNPSTDDRGEFRLFTRPGKLYLQAESIARPSSEEAEIRADGSSAPPYGPTFYPSAVVKGRAMVVEAIPGKEVSGLDIRLQRERTASTVSGTVSGIPQDGGVATVIAEFGENAERIASSRSVSTGPDGKFALGVSEPGFYRLTAIYRSDKTQMSSRPLEVEIESGSPPAVDLVLLPGIDVTGTLVMEGDPPGRPLGKFTIRLEPAAPGGFNPRLSNGEVDRDGTFHIGGMAPSRFRVRVDSLPENAYIKAVEVDGSVSHDGVVDVSSGRSSRLKVTVSRKGAQITGNVLDENGERTLSPMTIVLLLQDLKDWNRPTGSNTRITAESKYTLKSVRPGKYRLFAVDALSLISNSMEEIRKAFERAEEIEIKEGDRIVKDLRLTPKEDANASPKQ